MRKCSTHLDIALPLQLTSDDRVLSLVIVACFLARVRNLFATRQLSSDLLAWHLLFNALYETADVQRRQHLLRNQNAMPTTSGLALDEASEEYLTWWMSLVGILSQTPVLAYWVASSIR